MGSLSDLVSSVMGDTSDVESIDKDTSNMIQGLLSQQQVQQQQQMQAQGAQQKNQLASAAAPAVSSSPSIDTYSMSDINSKYNIIKGNEELDKLLNDVYFRLKGKQNGI